MRIIYRALSFLIDSRRCLFAILHASSQIKQSESSLSLLLSFFFLTGAARCVSGVPELSVSVVTASGTEDDKISSMWLTGVELGPRTRSGGKEDGGEQQTGSTEVKSCTLLCLTVKLTLQHLQYSQTVCARRLPLGNWAVDYRRGGSKWRAEEQLQQRNGEGSGIYIYDQAIWSRACRFTSPHCCSHSGRQHTNPTSCIIAFMLDIDY